MFDREREGDAASGWAPGSISISSCCSSLISDSSSRPRNFGTYLQELQSRFEGPVVADMVCLLRLQLELSVQAQRAADGAPGRPGPARRRRPAAPTLAEMTFLRGSIGTTGLLALQAPAGQYHGRRTTIATSLSRPEPEKA